MSGEAGGTDNGPDERAVPVAAARSHGNETGCVGGLKLYGISKPQQLRELAFFKTGDRGGAGGWRSRLGCTAPPVAPMLLEVSSVTLAVSLLLRLILSSVPSLSWIAPTLWVWGPLVALRGRHQRVAPYGYSVRPWGQVSVRAMLVGGAILGGWAALTVGWRLWTGGATLPAVHLPAREMVVAHLVLVAVPEELFFRGYAQERLRLWAMQRRLPVAPSAILLSAALFALAHVIVRPSWWRAAVFFPGCVMGWLRIRSGGLLVPALFHWLANLLVLVV